jgi:HK97 family phage major capsid protein
MTNEEKAAHDALTNEVKSIVDKAVENKADSKEITELKAKLDNAVSKEDFEIVKQEAIRLAGEVKALNEKPTVEKGYGSFNEALVAAFADKADEINAIVKSGGAQTAPLKVTVKAVDAISVASTIGAGSTQVSITENTGIINPIRKREQVYLANVSVGSIGTNRAVWIDETDEEGTPVMIAEGAAKTQLDVQYVEQTMAVKKIAVYGKVTTELMADIPQLISYIQNNLMRRMDIVLENQLFSGNGVGENLKGLYQYATAFEAGSLANSIPFANELDVIEAIALQAKIAYGMPSAIFINPVTMAAIKLIKDSTGRPVWKDYVTIDGSMNVSGMRLIETVAVTAGNFIGGDLSVVNVLKRSELGITIGLDGNDFTQNKKTMLLEKRMVQFVSANDTAVLVKGDFATAKAALLLV